MSEENVGLIRGLYEAFGRGDVPAIISKLDKDIEWREAENFIYAVIPTLAHRRFWKACS